MFGCEMALDPPQPNYLWVNVIRQTVLSMPTQMLLLDDDGGNGMYPFHCP